MADKPLSVVIPAYNVADYIGECIGSVVRQPGASAMLEVFVVVDGATDATLDMARRAATGHEDFVHVIAQDNAGLSAARNTGLAAVATPYVTFLDGDDLWQPKYLASILPLISGTSPDLIEYDALLIDERGAAIGPLKIASADEGTSRPSELDDFLRIFRCYSWARVYRTALVRNHPFPVGRRFEDTATTPWYYWSGRRYISLGHALVGYRQRPHSILKSPSPQDVEDLAATIAEAAAMFANTRSAYWQKVAHRAFQQACRRITWQPLSTWPGSLHTARSAIAGVPRPPGFARWLQAEATPLYTALLWFKRVFLRN